MNDKPFEYLVHDWARAQYELTLAQQPKTGRICSGKGGKGGILDPIPIVKLRVHDGDGSNKFIFSPHMFMIARLTRVDRDKPNELTDDSKLLHGNLSATNTKLRDDNNVAGENASYFIYPDIAISEEGVYRLTFNLWENQIEHTQQCVAVLLASITTDKFKVYLPKDFEGTEPSSVLARQFHQQGHKSIKLRSEPRTSRRRTGNFSPANSSFMGGSSTVGLSYHHRSDSQAPNYYTAPTYPSYSQSYGRESEVSQADRSQRYGYNSDTLPPVYNRYTLPESTFRPLDTIPTLTRPASQYRDNSRFYLSSGPQDSMLSTQDSVPRQLPPRTMEPDGNPFPSYANGMSFGKNEQVSSDKFRCSF